LPWIIFTLANLDFALQSKFMEPKWAEENLQTIRTLMEQSAVYRRALAPIMLFAGLVGIIAAGTGIFLRLNSIRSFGVLWLAAATIAVVGAFSIARRQALKEKEFFWSPPTRRVGQALLPALFVGLCLSIPFIIENPDPLLVGMNHVRMVFVTQAWILFYGCALTSAGFFMPRGIKIFGWLFIAGGCGLFYYFSTSESANFEFNTHWLMGFFFGVLHLAYGAYLYLTEKKNPVA
jgi:hypothetical protein